MCPSKAQLIRLAAGELDAADSGRLREHLGECDACRQSYATLAKTWRQLGLWTVQAPPRDLSVSVRKLVLADTARRANRLWWARVAAVLALSAGAGVAAGLLKPVPQHPVAAVSDAELAEELGLDVLSSGASIFGNLFHVDAIEGGQL